MADEKKYVDPNPFADYGAAMKSTPGNPMAVEWQNAQEAALVAATSDAALEACVATPAAAEALLKLGCTVTVNDSKPEQKLEGLEPLKEKCYVICIIGNPSMDFLCAFGSPHRNLCVGILVERQNE